MKVFLATNNKGKIERLRRLVNHISPELELVTPEELGLYKDVEENGSSLLENAEIKARNYLGETDYPILANDTGFFIEGEGLIEAPKRQALGDKKESELSREELSKTLLEFWKSVATKHGGKVNAAWIESFVVLYPDGSSKEAESKREVILTNKEHGIPHIDMPIRALYISKATNKPALSHSEEDEIKEMEPVLAALAQVLSL